MVKNVIFFKKKKPREDYIPVDIVQDLASKGMSEQEIVAQLRKQGFSLYQIEKALSIALKSTITGTPEKVVPGPMVKPAIEPTKLPSPPPSPLEPLPMEQKPPEFTFEENVQEIFEKPPPPPKPEETGPEITLEEIVEGIVAERLSRLEEKFSLFERKDQQLQEQINDLKKQIEELKESLRKSETSFIGKLEEYGEHVSTIEARIGGIERVFKEFLPELTENIRMMASMMEKLKKERG
jgi:DNA-binding transcriptional MerR regulator